MSNILVLSKKDIDRLLSQGDAKVANEIVNLMQQTFEEYSKNRNSPKVQSPQRIGIQMDSHQVLFMPSRLDQTTSIKIVSVPTRDGLSGLPATNLVMDPLTGTVKAILNAGALTAVRTAAGSGLATRYYAHPTAQRLVVFGAGAQGRAHIQMMIAVRPSLHEIAVWNRSQERLEGLLNELRETYPDKVFRSALEDLEGVVREADIICTCTNATEPVLKGAWLKAGVHLNCVGSYRLDMHEVDTEVVKRAELIVVDSVEACSHEAGELVKSSSPERWLELGLVESGDHQKISLFKSVGISVQDSAISGLMVERAQKENLGTLVPF